jgi:hypothetical protein
VRRCRSLAVALIAAAVLPAQSAVSAAVRVQHTVLEDDNLSPFSPRSLPS